eukprot:1155707-Pelagomonas_calceolata.AAC.2
MLKRSRKLRKESAGRCRNLKESNQKRRRLKRSPGDFSRGMLASMRGRSMGTTKRCAGLNKAEMHKKQDSEQGPPGHARTSQSCKDLPVMQGPPGHARSSRSCKDLQVMQGLPGHARTSRSCKDFPIMQGPPNHARTSRSCKDLPVMQGLPGHATRQSSGP